MGKRNDRVLRQLNRIAENSNSSFFQELEEKRERAKRKAKAEVNRRLRNRDAIPEQRTAKPLPGQLSLFEQPTTKEVQ